MMITTTTTPINISKSVSKYFPWCDFKRSYFNFMIGLKWEANTNL